MSWRDHEPEEPEPFIGGHLFHGNDPAIQINRFRGSIEEED
jgi:hypothetical protein